MSGKAEDGLDCYVDILDRFAEVESFEHDQAREMEQEFRELVTVAQTLKTALSAVSRPIPSRNINRTPFESAGQARAWIHSASTSMRDSVTFAQLASRVVEALVDPPPIDRMGVHPIPVDDAETAHQLRIEVLDELVRDAPGATQTMQALEDFLDELTRRRDAVCASLTDARLEIAQRLPGALDSLRLSQPTVQMWANAVQTRLGQLRQAVHAWDDVTVQRLAKEIEGIHERLGAVSRDALVDPPPIDRMGVHPVPADDAETAHRLRLGALDELVRGAPGAAQTMQALEGFLDELTRRSDAVCESLTNARLEIAQRLPGALDSLRLSQSTVQMWANAVQIRLGQLRQAIHAWDDVSVQRLAKEIEGLYERLGTVSRKVAGVSLPPAIEKMGIHPVPKDRLSEFDQARERIFAEIAAGGSGNEAIDAIVGIFRELSDKHARITATLTGKLLQLAQRVGALARQDCGTVGRIHAWQGKAQRCIGALRPAVHAWDSASVERISTEINALSASGRQLRKKLSIEAKRMKSEAQRRETEIEGMVATLKRTREYGGLLPRLKKGLMTGSLAAAGVAIALIVGLPVAGIKEHFLLAALVGSVAVGVGVGWRRAFRISVDIEKQIEAQENAISQLQHEREQLLADLSPLEAVLEWFAP